MIINKMSRYLKIIVFLSGILLFGLSTYSGATAAPGELPKIANPADWLQVKIPTAKFSNINYCDNDSTKLCIGWIGEYVAGIYKYAIGVVGILATVVMMIGGVMWIISGGNASTIGEAKSWITASITGLLITLSSYMILYQINPELVRMKPLEIKMIEEIEGDSNARAISDTDISGQNIAPGTVQVVVSEMMGKYTYSQEKRLTSDNGTTYIDCSSFACTVLSKSRVVDLDPGSCTTASLFAHSQSSSADLTKLPAGTLVGWPPSASKAGGHVWVSLGDGKFAQARGGDAGRTQGQSINIVNYTDVLQATERLTGKATPYIRTF